MKKYTGPVVILIFLSYLTLFAETLYPDILISSDPGISWLESSKLLVLPDAPLLSSPPKDTINQNIKMMFKWLSSPGADLYNFQLSEDQSFSSLIIIDSALTDTVFNYDLLSNSTKYYWRVRAQDTTGFSSWSEVWSFTTIISAPEKPELAFPIDSSDNLPVDLTLKWNKVLRAEKYILQVSSNNSFSSLVLNDSLVDTQKKVNPLVNDMTYFWRIKAVNIGGASTWSQIWRFKTIIAAPNRPSLFEPANNALNQPVDLLLKWRKIREAVQYHLQISTLPDFTSLVLNEETLTDSLIQASGLKSNTNYYWRVRASNIGGYGPWSAIWIFKTTVSPPAAPALSSPANGSKDQPVNLKLSWKTSQNASTYRVIISQDTLFTNLIADDSTLTTSTKSISALKSGMKYYWKVRAKNIAGISSYSPVWSFSTLLPPPGTLKAEVYGLGKVKLSWTDKTDGEMGFILERNTDKQTGYQIIDSIKADTTSCIDSTVLLSTTYKYRLKAYTQFAASAYTPEVSVTTLTSVENGLNGIPAEYALLQNYPNPFNPSTIIRYSLRTESKVRISVFNSLGQVVSELISKVQPGGYYEEVFNAGSLPSGIYIYSVSLQSTDGKNNFSSVKKMMLIK